MSGWFRPCRRSRYWWRRCHKLSARKPFPQTGFADALKKLIKVDAGFGVLEALVIHDEALDDQFFQLCCGPVAELYATGGTDAITDCEYGFKVVVFDFAFNLAGALDLNCCIFCNSCHMIELPLFVDVFQMLRNNRLIASEKFGHLVE